MIKPGDPIVTEIRRRLQKNQEERSLLKSLLRIALRNEDRRRSSALATLTIWRPAYDRVRYFRLLGREEDVQSGSWVQAWAGGTSSVLGSVRSSTPASSPS